MKFNLPSIGTDTDPKYTDIIGSYTDGKAFKIIASWELYTKGQSIGTNSDGSEIKYEGETEIFESVEIGTIIPIDWEFTKRTGSLTIFSNNPKLADSYEPIKSYLSPRLIISSDMYKDIQNHTQCTKQDLIEQTMHYTGKTWAYKGLNGYTNDGFELYYEIPVTVNYKTKSTISKDPKADEQGFLHHKATQIFKIQCIPDKSVQRFKELYTQECSPKESEYRTNLLK